MKRKLNDNLKSNGKSRLLKERYHGSLSLWTGNFNMNKISSASGDYGYNGWGIYLTIKRGYAEAYAYDGRSLATGYVYEFVFVPPGQNAQNSNVKRKKFERFNSLSRYAREKYFIDCYEQLPYDTFRKYVELAHSLGLLNEKKKREFLENIGKDRRFVLIVKAIADKHRFSEVTQGGKEFYLALKDIYGKAGHIINDEGCETFVIYDSSFIKLLNIEKTFYMARVSDRAVGEIYFVNYKPTRKEVDRLISYVFEQDMRGSFSLKYQVNDTMNLLMIAVTILKSKQTRFDLKAKKAAFLFLKNFSQSDLQIIFSKFESFNEDLYDGLMRYIFGVGEGALFGGLKAYFNKLKDMLSKYDLSLQDKDLQDLEKLKADPKYRMVISVFERCYKNINYFRSLSAEMTLLIYIYCLDLFFSRSNYKLSNKSHKPLFKAAAFLMKNYFLPSGYEAFDNELKRYRYGSALMRYINYNLNSHSYRITLERNIMDLLDDYEAKYLPIS